MDQKHQSECEPTEVTEREQTAQLQELDEARLDQIYGGVGSGAGFDDANSGGAG
jgi:hypothetical protein